MTWLLRAFRPGLVTLVLLAAGSSCSEPAPSGPETGVAETAHVAPEADTGPQAGDAMAQQAEPPETVGGVLPEETTVTQPVTAPGLVSVVPADPNPELALDAEAPGRATARWGKGPEVDSASPWRSVAGDGIHERENEAIGLLQNPRSAMRELPRANSGNYVDWVAAVREGSIRPRARVGSQGAMEVLDLDVRFSDTKGMPYVTFPHAAHTEWLSCGNCHDWLFKKLSGSADISMADIARGRACGMCHGKVAFPATECFRCHNGPRPKG